MELRTYADLVDAIREALGVASSDTSAINKIKRQVNMYYLDEVIPFKRWQWLEKNVQIVHRDAYAQDTALVTPNSVDVELSSAPSIDLGSFTGYRFSTDSSNAVYTISTHTAGSTSLTLTSAFQEAINTAAEFQIWRDKIDLPAAAKETIEMWHSENNKPVKAVGSQDFRKLETAQPKLEGFPSFYNTHDFYDPSPSDAETESDRYRQTRIFPSITKVPITLNVDYIEEPVALDDETDEPVLPIGDRVVIYYGAGAECWSILERDEEMADKWRAKAMAKLARMAGEREDGMDTPSLSPRSSYLNSIRKSGLRRSNIVPASSSGGQSVALPTFARDITLEGGNITDDFTVVDGVTIDGRDISEDGALLDSLAGIETTTLTNNTIAGVALSWDLSETDSVHIRYSLTRGTDKRLGQVMLGASGILTAINDGAIAEISDVGITFDVDISGGNLRLLYTSTNTGNDTNFTYQALTWLG